MSAFAASGRSPSACTVTGLSSTRTPHSSAVPMWSSPLENSRPEHLLHRAADHVEVAEARELARAPARADQPSPAGRG